MARPTSLDPSEPVTISLPRSIKRISLATARGKHLSLSAWIAELIRDHFQRVEKALR